MIEWTESNIIKCFGLFLCIMIFGPMALWLIFNIVFFIRYIIIQDCIDKLKGTKNTLYEESIAWMNTK